MRPAILNPLFTPVTTLSGVGPKQDKLLRYLLDRSDTPRLVDLLLHLPTGVIDRRARPKIRDAVPGTVVTLAVTIDRHRPSPPGRSRAPYLVHAGDDTGGTRYCINSVSLDFQPASGTTAGSATPPGDAAQR